VLDMEWNPFSPTCQRRPDAAVVRSEMRIWLDKVEAHFGQRPVIYTTPRFYEDAGLSAMKNEEFWLRTTAKTPAQAFPGQRWRFWQYTATGTLPNTPGAVDINAFNGTKADWQNWLASRSVR
jgi:lysozyme